MKEIICILALLLAFWACFVRKTDSQWQSRINDKLFEITDRHDEEITSMGDTLKYHHEGLLNHADVLRSMQGEAVVWH
jgi:hypothetical protein